MSDIWNYTHLSSGTKYVERKKTDTVVWHRCTVAPDPAGLVAEFQNTAKYRGGWYTGGKTPYHIFIPANGEIAQLVPLAYNVPGALSYNSHSIQIAWERDTRKVPLRAAQRDAVIYVCTLLHEAFNETLKFVGHTEETSAGSLDPDKVCPGTKTSLMRLRQDIAASTDELHVLNPWAYLKNHGFEIRYES